MGLTRNPYRLAHMKLSSNGLFSVLAEADIVPLFADPIPQVLTKLYQVPAGRVASLANLNSGFTRGTVGAFNLETYLVPPAGAAAAGNLMGNTQYTTTSNQSSNLLLQATITEGWSLWVKANGNPGTTALFWQLFEYDADEIATQGLEILGPFNPTSAGDTLLYTAPSDGENRAVIVSLQNPSEASVTPVFKVERAANPGVKHIVNIPGSAASSVASPGNSGAIISRVFVIAPGDKVYAGLLAGAGPINAFVAVALADA